jgi:hypothetical protein
MAEAHQLRPARRRNGLAGGKAVFERIGRRLPEYDFCPRPHRFLKQKFEHVALRLRVMTGPEAVAAADPEEGAGLLPRNR